MQTNDNTYLIIDEKKKPSTVPIIVSCLISGFIIILMIMNEYNNMTSKIHTRWNLIGTLFKSIGILIAILLLNKQGQQNWVISLLFVDLFPLILFRDTSLYHIL